MARNPGNLLLGLFLILVAGSVTAGGAWLFLQSRNVSTLDTTGFNVEAARAAPAESYAASRGPAAPESSLAMIKSAPGLKFGTAAGDAGAQNAGAPQDGGPQKGLNELARTKSQRLSAFTQRFRDRHPIMRQYSKMWLGQPDLKKLNDDYMKDRDLVKFLAGLKRSPSFGPLVKKIALDPKSHALAMDFITGAVRETPPELVSAASDHVKKDGGLLNMLTGVFSAMNAPPGLLKALSGGALDPKAAQEKLGKAMDDPRLR